MVSTAPIWEPMALRGNYLGPDLLIALRGNHLTADEQTFSSMDDLAERGGSCYSGRIKHSIVGILLQSLMIFDVAGVLLPRCAIC